MPKYWGKQIFRHRSFPKVGQKQKNGEKKRRGLNDGDNNGQATHGARKHAWAKSRWKQWQTSLPSATMGGARKPPGPIF